MYLSFASAQSSMLHTCNNKEFSFYTDFLKEDMQQLNIHGVYIPDNPAGADKSEGVLGAWGGLKNLHSTALLACKAGHNFFNALKSKTSCFCRITLFVFLQYLC